MMRIEKIAQEGQWWALAATPVAIVLGIGESPWLVTGIFVLALPLTAVLAVPLLLRELLALRRGERAMPRPFAYATVIVWASVLVVAIGLGSGVGRSGVESALILLGVAWLVQLATVGTRPTASVVLTGAVRGWARPGPGPGAS
ncbi:hypothetical protein [Isoptericola sp. NPDC057191]|uniref:hypothetical protein n=1 Tax=Isoptericola sp. NPDC057191 TaxID=3346041 RepID=UPI003634410D